MRLNRRKDDDIFVDLIFFLAKNIFVISFKILWRIFCLSIKHGPFIIQAFKSVIGAAIIVVKLVISHIIIGAKNLFSHPFTLKYIGNVIIFAIIGCVTGIVTGIIATYGNIACGYDGSHVIIRQVTETVCDRNLTIVAFIGTIIGAIIATLSTALSAVLNIGAKRYFSRLFTLKYIGNVITFAIIGCVIGIVTGIATYGNIACEYDGSHVIIRQVTETVCDRNLTIVAFIGTIIGAIVATLSTALSVDLNIGAQRYFSRLFTLKHISNVTTFAIIGCVIGIVTGIAMYGNIACEYDGSHVIIRQVTKTVCDRNLTIVAFIGAIIGAIIATLSTALSADLNTVHTTEKENTNKRHNAYLP